MDLQIIRNVGQVASPPVEGRAAATGNSINVTSAGDFFFLDERGTVHFTNIRPVTSAENNATNKSIQSIPLPVGVDLSNLRHICNNSDSSLLCLWSETKAILVEIPAEWIKEGTLKIVKKKEDAANKQQDTATVSVIYDLQADAEKRKIAKVSFHPANEHSIVILFETDKLMVYDARSAQPQTFHLPRDHNYTSFSFGPNLEWLRFTIFLTTTSNQLYALCPIIPYGTMVSSAVVEELWSWLEETEGRLLSSASSSSNKQDHHTGAVAYIELMRNYLLGMLGSKESLVQDSFVVAGESDDLSFAFKLSCGVDSSSSTYASIHSIFDRHRLQLQGPLTPTSSSSNQNICDIAIPSVKYSDIAPPVLVVAYSSGAVDVLLLDAKDTSSWFIAPSWSSVNHKRPYPSLVVADSFIVDSTSRKGQWRIVPDPVFAHNFYLCDCKEGEVFLISSGWLHSSLKSIAQALQTLSNSDGDNEGKTADAANLVLDRTPSPSQCIPIYAPKSKSNAGLNGIFIVQDPFIGHVAFIRLDSKQLIAINITMHTKLCQLQMSIRDEDGEPAGDLRKEFDQIMRSDNIIWRHAHDLLTQIAKGLKVLPTLEVTVNSEADSVGGQSEAQNKKFLLETVQLLEKNVILPMKELKDCTTFHLNVVEQMYKVQQELIDGRSTIANKSGTTDKNKHNNAFDLSAGLRTLIKDLAEENKSLVARLEVIEAKYLTLKDQAECMLSLIYTNYPRKISDAERLYKDQLQTWSDTVSTMTKDIEVVRKLAKPAPKVYPLANPTEIKKNQLHTFSSPQPFNSGKKVPSTPFSPLFTQASTSNFLSSPANDFGSPVSKLDFISANPVNVSWSSSKIYQNNTPSKIGLNGSYQQSPTTKVTANFVNTPKPADTTTINPPEPVKLSEEEEKACNELLRKQGELLVEAKRKVEDLEKKLSNMKLEADTTSYLK